MDLAAFITMITGLAEVASKAGSALEKLRKQRLSDEERELLRGALPSGEFFVFDGEQLPGATIRTDGCLYDIEDPEVSARFRGAFKRLAELGYLERDAGQLFRLTRDGWDRAKALSANSSD